MRVLNKRLWPHQFKLPVQDRCVTDNRIMWLKNNLSKEAWRYNEINATFCFAEKDDAVLFKLSCA